MHSLWNAGELARRWKSRAPLTRKPRATPGEAARSTQEVFTNIAGVSRGAGMTESAADHVLASADQLGSTSLHLKQEVDAFLAAIPAA